jgi:hypothetical protein
MPVVINGTTGITTPTESVATTIGVGGATPSTSGAGITFPATKNPSSNANTLDDYEEGSFTPSIIGSTSAGTASYSNRDGRYTKIGRFVHVVITLVWTGHTGTGNMLVSGLPFSVLAGDNPSTLNLINATSLTGQVATELTSGATTGRLFAVNNGSAAQLGISAAATYELTIGYFTST